MCELNCPACCRLRQLNTLSDRNTSHLEHELEPSPEYFPASQIRQKSIESNLYSPAGHERVHVLLDKGGDQVGVGERWQRVRIGEGVVCDVDC